LKIVKKQIEKEIEQLQKNLRAEEVYVSLGKFVRTSTFIMKVDKPKLLKSISKDDFIKAASFTKTNLTNVIPADKILKLENKNIIWYAQGKNSLKFYTDKTIQLPKINISINDEKSNFEYIINP